MHALHITYVAFSRIPTEKAHGAQIMKTCEAFAHEGAEVELVIPGRKTPVSGNPFSYYEVIKNFTITNLHTPDWVRLGRIGFILSALWFAEVVKWQKSFWKADVIYSRDAFVLLQYILLGRMLVYEAHTKPTFMSRFIAKHAHKLVVISEGLQDAYVKSGIPKEKIIVAHDAIDPEPFKKHYDQKESRDWLSIPRDKKVALYVGRIDAAKGADMFAETSELVPADTLCVLIGHGPLVENLKEKYPKALFLPETPYRELPRVLSAADVLVLPNSGRDENAAVYTSPLKAFAYLASEKPIVASAVPALKEILTGNVEFFMPDNPNDLARVLRNISNNSSSTRPVAHFSWGKRAQTILKHITHETGIVT